jgi:SAM-dependent methyltransferase
MRWRVVCTASRNMSSDPIPSRYAIHHRSNPLPKLVKTFATHWRVKGAIQKVLGHLPGGGRIHFLLQRHTGGLADFRGECDIKIEDWRLMMGHLATAKIDLREAMLLEIGTGWYPTFPLCLYLAGAGRVLTYDITRHLKLDMTLKLVERLALHVPVIARTSGRPEAEIAARREALYTALARGASLEAATNNRISYRAPADASATMLPTGSVDVVFSNSVLEHVPPDALHACFAESMRILKPGGIVFHSVNCGDHYSYTDRSINQLNYLQFSEARWRMWNNSFLYQNRLRAIDFTRIANSVGFEIEIDTSRANPKRLAQLAGLAIDPQFTGYTREQLAITSIDFVGRKPAHVHQHAIDVLVRATDRLPPQPAAAAAWRVIPDEPDVVAPTP